MGRVSTDVPLPYHLQDYKVAGSFGLFRDWVEIHTSIG
jgi:hypothetical protein